MYTACTERWRMATRPTTPNGDTDMSNHDEKMTGHYHTLIMTNTNKALSCITDGSRRFKKGLKQRFTVV